MVRVAALLLLSLVACEQPPAPPAPPPLFAVPAADPAAAFQVPTGVLTTRATPSLEPSRPAVANDITKVVLTIRGGLLTGAAADIIDAVDAAFVGRLDLLALLNEGDQVIGWQRNGIVVAAAAPLGGRVFEVARFDDASNHGWFDASGMGMDGTFRSRPVNASRITSRYGLRFHPVDKEMRLHKGTDYGAAVGTPIFSTAAGIVSTITEDSSAGKHIKLTHTGGAETLYLHMSASAAGLSKGATVTAGQLIGYVGTTGKSTGPHLHYEQRYAGVAVDATRMIPKGLTALGPSQMSQHLAFLNSLPK